MQEDGKAFHRICSFRIRAMDTSVGGFVLWG
jgi:hypothetical protein